MKVNKRATGGVNGIIFAYDTMIEPTSDEVFFDQFPKGTLASFEADVSNKSFWCEGLMICSFYCKHSDKLSPVNND